MTTDYTWYIKGHIALRHTIDRPYLPKPFASDTERVALLFEKYQEATNGA